MILIFGGSGLAAGPSGLVVGATCTPDGVCTVVGCSVGDVALFSDSASSLLSPDGAALCVSCAQPASSSATINRRLTARRLPRATRACPSATAAAPADT